MLPLGYTGASIEELNRFENSTNGNRNDSREGKDDKKRGIDEREEWMLNPGEDRAIAGLLEFNSIYYIVIKYYLFAFLQIFSILFILLILLSLLFILILSLHVIISFFNFTF